MKKINIRKFGFTIPELLIAIVIIGVLTSITYVSYKRTITNSRKVSLESTLVSNQEQINTDKSTSGFYPINNGSISNGGIKKIPGVTYSYYASKTYYCLSAYFDDDIDGARYVNSLSEGVQEGVCNTSWKNVFSGNYNTCAISNNDEPYCWGNNYYSVLANSSVSGPSAKPVPVSQGEMPSKKVKSIAVGAYHACAINFDDDVYCWGYGGYGQLGNGTAGTTNSPKKISRGDIPAGQIKQLVSGNSHSCVVASDDKVYCWGLNTYGQLGNGNTTSQSTPVAVLQGTMPSQTVKSIAAGYRNTCALSMANNVYCWGNNSAGQLGIGNTTTSSSPVTVTTGVLPSGQVSQISVGDYTVCAITSVQGIYCWGYNLYGQLGNSSTTNQNVPVAVSRGSMPTGPTKYISTANYHSCVIASDDKMYCWGKDEYGAVGTKASGGGVSTPVAVDIGEMTAFTASVVSAGGNHTCAISTDTRIYCWGSDDSGELAIGQFNEVSVPTKIVSSLLPTGVKTTSLSNGGYMHDCMIGTDSKGYCWGQGVYGQLGDGTLINRYFAKGILSGAMSTLKLQKISSGGFYSCAVTESFYPYCWGKNDYGQLGDDTDTEYSNKPVALVLGDRADSRVYDVATGYQFACAIDYYNEGAYCWGSNMYGQLGDGTLVDKYVPTAVLQGNMPSTTISKISAGLYHACAIASDNQAYCWGQGTSGQLGNNAVANSSTPVAVAQGDMPSLIVKQITTGNSYSCAIASDDQIYCWGANSGGQLGNGTLTNSRVPKLVSQGQRPNLTAKTISAGTDTTCMLGSDDQGYCWGRNSNSHVGNGTLSLYINTPAAISIGQMPSLTIKSIVAGYYSMCAIGIDDNTYCWGDNDLGQVGTDYHSGLDNQTPRLIVAASQ